MRVEPRRCWKRFTPNARPSSATRTRHEGRRKALASVIGYLEPRLAMMDYAALAASRIW